MKLLSIVILFTMLLSSQKLEVKADKFIAKDSQNRVSFLGNAHISQGGTRIDADKIIIEFADDDTTKQYEAKGRVKFILKIKTVHYTGKCQSMKYVPSRHIYILRGRVSLQDKKRHRSIIGEHIEIDIKQKSFIINGKKQKQAKLIFNIK